MRKFIKTTRHTEFYTNKDIDVQKLSEEIRSLLEVDRWEDTSDKDGYSGISIERNEKWLTQGKPGKMRLIVHWTTDGISGFNIELPEEIAVKVRELIENHKPDKIWKNPVNTENNF